MMMCLSPRLFEIMYCKMNPLSSHSPNSGRRRELWCQAMISCSGENLACSGPTIQGKATSVWSNDYGMHDIELATTPRLTMMHALRSKDSGMHNIEYIPPPLDPRRRAQRFTPMARHLQSMSVCCHVVGEYTCEMQYSETKILYTV